MGNSRLVVARATGGSLGSILLISAFPKRGISPQRGGSVPKQWAFIQGGMCQLISLMRKVFKGEEKGQTKCSEKREFVTNLSSLPPHSLTIS